MSQPDFRAMNAQMAQRLLDTAPEPIADGSYGLRVLEVAGRRSGEPHRTPVGLLMSDGRAHLVSPDRRRDWPTNLTAAGRGAVLGGTERTDVTARELHGVEAAEIVHQYLSVVTVPWARDAFGVPSDAGVEEIRTQVDKMAVFVLSPLEASR